MSLDESHCLLAAVSWDELEGAQDLSSLEHCCPCLGNVASGTSALQLRPDPNCLSWEMLPWSWCLSWRIRPKGLLGPDDKGKDPRSRWRMSMLTCRKKAVLKVFMWWKERDGFNCTLVPDSMTIMGWVEITIITAHNSSCSLSPAWKADSSNIVTLIWKCKKLSPYILTHASVHKGPSQK